MQSPGENVAAEAADGDGSRARDTDAAATLERDAQQGRDNATSPPPSPPPQTAPTTAGGAGSPSVLPQPGDASGDAAVACSPSAASELDESPPPAAQWSAERVRQLRKIVSNGQTADFFESRELAAFFSAQRAVKDMERRQAHVLRREQAECAERMHRAKLQLRVHEHERLEKQWEADALDAKLQRLAGNLAFIERGWTAE